MPQDSLTITDNRTGRTYEVPVSEGTVRATDLRQIKVSDDDFGLMTYDPAFMNTAACRSAITFIDGDRGILRYRGYPIEQLADQASFLEVAYLLIEGELPTKTQLTKWTETVKYHTYVHTNITKFLEGFRYDAHPMGVLLGVVGALSTFYPDAKDIHDPENRKLQRVRLLAKAPTIAAFAFRHSRGLPFVFPDNDLDYIANFVNMTFSIGGRHKPNKVLQRALEILLILHADHEQNCSTSAVRGVGSSHVDPFSAVSAGIAALYGPLHGGANEAVLAMLDEIGDKKNIPAFIKEVKGGGGRLMGFGHRVYKSYDPRAKLIKRVADDVFRGDRAQSEAGDRDGAGADRAGGRVLHQAEALPQRGLLLRPDLPGDGLSDRVLHRALRPGPDAGVAGPVGGDAAGQGPEDRPAAADLHRQARSGRSCRSRSADDDHRPARYPALRAAALPPAPGLRGARERGTAALYQAAAQDRKGTGPTRHAPSTGSGPGTGCWSGTRRTPSGSSAASSTSPPTASTAI